MGEKIVAMALTPRRVFAGVVEELRARYPGAQVTALVGTEEALEEQGLGAPDEVIKWHELGVRGVVAELRRRKLDLFVVAHGRDYYARAAYWKALALAIMSGSRGKLFCPDGVLGERIAPGGNASTVGRSLVAVLMAIVRGLTRMMMRPAVELYIAAAGSLLVVVLLAAAITDAIGPTAEEGGRRRKGGRARQS